jgi:hypothetical protein
MNALLRRAEMHSRNGTSWKSITSAIDTLAADQLRGDGALSRPRRAALIAAASAPSRSFT